MTLIEALVVVLIVAIVLLLAAPHYLQYALKTRFAEVILATSVDRTMIDGCVQDATCLSTDGLSIDMNRVAAPKLPDGEGFSPSTYVARLTHTEDGRITPTSVASGYGFDQGYTYTLIPVLLPNTTAQRVDWTVDPISTCKTRLQGSLC